MLILVAVTITVAVSGGLFEYAGRTGRETNEAIEKEQKLADGKVKIGDKWYASLDDYLEGRVLVELPEGLKVGDYVNYIPDVGTYTVASGSTGSGYTSNQTFTTGSNLSWRVWSINEETGEVEIVLATAGPTLYLKGADGYNHAVDILNDLCETLYSKTVNGSKVATGRSINVKDINSKTTYSPIGEKNKDMGFTYKDTKRLSEYGIDHMKYPKLYSQEIGYGTARNFNNTGLDEETGLKNGTTEKGVTTYQAMGYINGYTEGTDPYVTHTYYGYNGSFFTYYPEECLDTSLGINTAQTGLIKLSSDYWLASRCVAAGNGGVASDGFAVFFVRGVTSRGFVCYNLLFCSDGSGGPKSNAVRPVVSLSSDIKLKPGVTANTWDFDTTAE